MGNKNLKDLQISNEGEDTIIKESEWITKIKQMNVPKDMKKFKTLRLPSKMDGSTWKTTRKDIQIPDGRGFLIQNLLTLEECDFFIHQLEDEIGFEDMSEKYPAEYRSNDRVHFVLS